MRKMSKNPYKLLMRNDILKRKSISKKQIGGLMMKLKKGLSLTLILAMVLSVFNFSSSFTKTAQAMTIHKFEAVNQAGKFITHQNGNGIITSIHLYLNKMSQWKIVPGLNLSASSATSSIISLESVNYPGYYLRQK